MNLPHARPVPQPLVQPLLSELHAMSPDQRVLRAMILVAPVVSVLATFLAAHQQEWWVLIPVVVLSLACVAQPDSNLGLMVIVVVTLHWIAVVEDRRTAWLVVAALGLCVFHCVAAASTVAASAAPWDSSMRRRWLRRGAVIAGITAAAWCMQAALAGGHFDGNAVLFLAALVLLTVVALAMRARSLTR